MKLELQRVSRLTPSARDARRVWPERQSVLLRLTDGRGQTGLGEASPLPGYSPESLDAVAQALGRLPTRGIEAALEQTPARAALRAAAGLLPPALPSARMALESALLDLLGRRQGLPAPLLLGAEPRAQRPLALLLGPALERTLPAQLDAGLSRGFRHFKLKLGAEGMLERELSAITGLREHFGPSIGLRLDANRALASNAVTRAWEVLEHAAIELFEEPGHVPAALLGTLPLALDESLQGLGEEQIEAELQRLRPRCLVLKPMALGGLDHCLRLAERARRSGIDVVLSHCFDGPLAFRAAAALALALPDQRAHGLGDHAALEAWPVPSPAPRGATLEGWSEPGLGALGSCWPS